MTSWGTRLSSMLLTVRSTILPVTVLLALALLLYTSTTPLMYGSRPSSGTKTGTSLRILPLGDSITEGYGSTDHNGYRLDLYNMLVKAGYTVEFIGSLTDGDNNPDPRHEGHGGYDIEEIYKAVVADSILDSYPNLVLLHAGTNDMIESTTLENDPYVSAPNRLGDLIDLVFEKCPQTTILLAKIIGDDRSGVQARIDAFNAALPDLVASRSLQHKIELVDQSRIGGNDLIDLIHPTDAGYKKMAQNWLKAIENLPEDWL